MKQKLIDLKELREGKNKLEDEYNERLEEFKQKYISLIERIQCHKENIDRVEIGIRTAALEKYKETGEKKLDFGVGIRVMQKLGYDSDIAFVWAKEHGLAIKLDNKSFEKIAKVQKLDFVEYRNEAIATIPREIKID